MWRERVREGEHDQAIHQFKNAAELAGARDNDFIVDLVSLTPPQGSERKHATY